MLQQLSLRPNVKSCNSHIASERGGYSFSCDNVVPLALGGEYPKYTVTALSGTLEGGNLSFGLNFGAYPTRFNGTRHARL